MNGNFRSVWAALVFQQIGSYRMATAVVANGLEACWQLAPQLPGEVCQPQNADPLNPLEFHGKRRSE